MEAQRLGLKAIAGDLNPVAVLINKAMIEIPPRFAGRPPVHPDLRSKISGDAGWERAQGLAADVETYGQWMRYEAERRIGHLYPAATGPDGEKLTPIAWIWARTVQSPDPAWAGPVPLVTTWHLSKKQGKSPIWIEPIINRGTQTISYRIRTGGAPTRQRTVDRGNGTCIATGAAIPNDYIKAEGRAGRIGAQLMAVVAEGPKTKIFLSTAQHQFEVPEPVEVEWSPAISLPKTGLGFRVQAYGYVEWSMLFSYRQLTALSTFSEILNDLRTLVAGHAISSGWVSDDKRLRDGGTGAVAYADAVVTYLAFVVDKCAAYWSKMCTWINSLEAMGQTFSLHALPMKWDFAEANPFSSSTGNWMNMVIWVRKAIEHLPARGVGQVVQGDATARVRSSDKVTISTDPPYYDNIGYADLSDFFFVWLRHNLVDVWPDECSTLLSPKEDELIADPGRHGGPLGAETHFESGMAEFMVELAKGHPEGLPGTIYYGYKATETKHGDTRSTGWDTFLQALVDAGLQVNSTWPMRTERPNRSRSLGSNALASSVVLACRPRPEEAQPATRTVFLAALRSELPEKIRLLQGGNIAPVDMAQSAIGPGISIFSRYSEVRYADGSAMPVSDALAIINEVLGEILDGEASELDEDTRFALDWYAQHGFEAAGSGDADNLARAKNTSLAGIGRAGIGEARAGKFRLYRRDELPEGWDPDRDDRLTAWEAAQHLVATLEQSETHAAGLLHRLGAEGDSARQLAYLLYAKADANDWTDEAFAYNMLISAWSDLRSMGSTTIGQGELL